LRLLSWRFLLLLGTLCLAAACSRNQGSQGRYIDSPLVKDGSITLVELGALSCKPCQMMAPIMAELTKEYAGRVDIRFINVHEDKTAAKKFGIMVIPTQILYNRQRLEVYRHAGFIEKDTLAKELDERLNADGKG